MGSVFSIKYCKKGEETLNLLKDPEKPTDLMSSWKALLIAFTIATVFLLGGMIFFALVEEWNYLDSLYFCVVTLCTVGYGDYVPQTTLGLWGCMFYILIGISMLGLSLGVIGSYLMARQEKLLQEAIDVTRGKRKRILSPSQWKLLFSLLVLVLVITIGAVAFYFLEEDIDFTHSCFLTVQTITTVGYGSPSIQSDAGKWFAIPFILVSTFVVASSLGTFADVFIERRQEKMAERILKADFDLEALLAMDTDGDAQITLAEFLEFMLVKMGKCSQMDINSVKNQFKELDADGSGVLDMEDIRIMKAKLTGKQGQDHKHSQDTA